MNCSFRKGWLVVGLGCAMLAAPVWAQKDNAKKRYKTPSIHISSQAEVELQADQAQMRFTVHSRAETAKLATNHNSSAVKAVMKAVRKLGIDEDEVHTDGYRAGPWNEYDQEQRKQVRKGFEVFNAVVVITKDFDLLGKLIDRAIKAGATSVSPISFSSSKSDEGRQEALRRAVARAKSDATVVAEAAGGTLGVLKSVRYGVPAPRPLLRMAMVGDESVESSSAPVIKPGALRVGVQIETSWGFLP